MDERIVVLERQVAELNARLRAAEEEAAAHGQRFEALRHRSSVLLCDVRIPLSAVTGYAELALDEQDYGEIRFFLNQIRVASRDIDGSLSAYVSVLRG